MLLILSSGLLTSEAGTVYWNPGDRIHRHDVEYEEVRRVARSWARPVNVSRVPTPPRLQDEIAFVNKRYAKPDAEGRLDIFRVEASWLRQMEGSLLDLTPRYGKLMDKFDRRAVEALTVNGKLLAVPSFLDSSKIYYRKDLLRKYNRTYPATWEELESTAEYIQAQERELDANGDFWGLLWQGSPNEILTVITMQFIASHGGGAIIEADGTISINNPRSVAALRRAKSWINWITPSSIINEHLHETKMPFLLEKALFLFDLSHIVGEIHSWRPQGADMFSCGERSFSSTVGVGNPPGSPAVYNISTPWYWGWSVNKYTPELEDTLRVLDYLASEQQQIFKATHSEDFPTRRQLQDNATITCGNRSRPTTCDMDIETQPLLRRSLAAIGPNYFKMSPVLFTGMHQYLVGEFESAEEAVQHMECSLYDAMGIDNIDQCLEAEVDEEEEYALYALLGLIPLMSIVFYCLLKRKGDAWAALLSIIVSESSMMIFDIVMNVLDFVSDVASFFVVWSDPTMEQFFVPYAIFVPLAGVSIVVHTYLGARLVGAILCSDESSKYSMAQIIVGRKRTMMLFDGSVVDLNNPEELQYLLIKSHKGIRLGLVSAMVFVFEDVPFTIINALMLISMGEVNVVILISFAINVFFVGMIPSVLIGLKNDYDLRRRILDEIATTIRSNTTDSSGLPCYTNGKSPGCRTNGSQTFKELWRMRRMSSGCGLEGRPEEQKQSRTISSITIRKGGLSTRDTPVLRPPVAKKGWLDSARYPDHKEGKTQSVAAGAAGASHEGKKGVHVRKTTASPGPKEESKANPIDEPKSLPAPRRKEDPAETGPRGAATQQGCEMTRI